MKSKLPEQLEREKIVRITTFDKDGTAGTVAMWFFYMSGRIYMSTDRESVKVRRIESDPRVELQFGKKRLGPVLRGSARIAADEEVIQKAAQGLFGKYDSSGQWWESVENMVRGFLRQDPSVLLEITLDDA